MEHSVEFSGSSKINMVKETFFLRIFRNNQVHFSEILGGASGNVLRDKVDKCDDCCLFFPLFY